MTRAALQTEIRILQAESRASALERRASGPERRASGPERGPRNVSTGGQAGETGTVGLGCRGSLCVSEKLGGWPSRRERRMEIRALRGDAPRAPWPSQGVVDDLGTSLPPTPWGYLYRSC